MKKTNLFIFDGQSEKLLTVLSNEDNGMSPYWEAPVEEQLNQDFIFEFKAPVNDNIAEGNLVAFMDSDGNYQLFQIYECVKYHVDGEVLVHSKCEHAFYELSDDIVEDLRIDGGTASDAMTKALSASRWQVGQVDSLGTGTVNFYYQNATKNLQDVVATFGGELRYRVTISGNSISGRYVDLLTRRGSDTGKRFEYTKDLLEVDRTVKVDGLKTALYGRGNGNQIDSTGGYTRKITFADVVWSKANGDPVDKPSGQEWVGDPTALANWGRSNGTRHRFDTFNVDSTDPTTILNETWKQLQKVNTPFVTYTLKVADLERIAGLSHEKVRLGDTVYVIDHDLNMRMEARVMKIVYSLDAPEDSEVTLGNFIVDINMYNSKLEQVQATITDRKGVWDKANDAITTVDDGNIAVATPQVPTNVSATGLFKSIVLSWTFDPSIKTSAYEVYASKVQGFTADSTNLVFRGKSGGFILDANTNETWYFRLRSLNPAGTASAYTQEFSASTLQIQTADYANLSIGDAQIHDVSADKMTVGTLDATKVSVINIDADNINVGKLKAQYVEIGSTTTFDTGYDPSTKTEQTDFNDLETRVSNVEIATTDDSIVSTVRSSTSYQNDLSSKANSSDLAGYASTDDLTSATQNANDYTDQQVGAVNATIGTNPDPNGTSVFEQITAVDQKADNIDIKFTSSGGVNLLKNSVGYAGTDFWTVTLDVDANNQPIGSVDTIQNAELEQEGVGSGIVLNGANLSQQVLDAPQWHTVTTIVKKGTAGSGYLKISYTDQNGVAQVNTTNFDSGTAYDYQKITVSFQTGGNSITVELYGTTDSGIIFTGTMLNVGEVALQWQHSAGEIYNTNVLMDLNGIRVNNSTYNGYTAITPEEFSGYAEIPDANNNLVMTKVFTLNKDVTEVSKIQVDQQIDMAPIKIVPVTGTYTGWAFIAD